MSYHSEPLIINTLSTILEKCIKTRVYIISSRNISFLQKISSDLEIIKIFNVPTSIALMLVNYIHNQLSERNFVLVVFFDVKKKFDFINIINETRKI